MRDLSAWGEERLLFEHGHRLDDPEGMVEVASWLAFLLRCRPRNGAAANGWMAPAASCSP